MSDPVPPVVPPAVPAAGFIARLAAWLERHRRWLAPLSFAAGLASFLLVRRGPHVAQVLAFTLVLSWLAILLEPLLARRLPRGLLRFLVQGVQQESFFFALPFFFATTQWHTPQAAVTLALGAAGAATLWDPLYYGVIARHRPLLLAFHALSVFAAMLVALPLLAHLTTAQSLSLAGAAVAVFALPALAMALDPPRPGTVAALTLAAAAIGALSWLARPWIPPATLWVNEARITDQVNPATREPGLFLVSVAPAHLHQQGLYAFMAIHAPRGLRERVIHRWMLNGKEVDRVPLDIAGGREQGYRAWSFKRGFPEDPRGEWEVQAITDGGQLIGSVRFVVIGDAPVIEPAVPVPEPPPPPEAPVQQPET